MKKIKFIVIAGSSGGHILPAIKYLNSLADIKNPDEILFVTNEKGSSYIENIKNKKINKINVNSKSKLNFIIKIFFNLISFFIFNRKIC